MVKNIRQSKLTKIYNEKLKEYHILLYDINILRCMLYTKGDILDNNVTSKANNDIHKFRILLRDLTQKIKELKFEIKNSNKQYQIMNYV